MKPLAMTPRARVRPSFLALFALAFLMACSKAPPSAQTGLMVIVSTDLQPSEYDQLEVQISQETTPGGSWHVWMDRLATVPAEITLPTTVLIQSGASADQDVLIRAILYDHGAPIVLREAQLQVPTDRLAELRFVLAEACKGQVAQSGAEGSVVSTCPTAGESCQPLTGLCASGVISNTSQLPSYKAGDENLDAGAGPPSTATDAGGSMDHASDAGEPSDDSGDATLSVADAEQPDDVTSAEVVPETSTTEAPDVDAGGPTCENACTSGTTQCGTGLVETCSVGAGGCTQWKQTATCGTNQLCVVGDAGVSSCACKSSACQQTGTVCTGSQTLGTCSEDADGCLFIASTMACTTPQACSGMPPNSDCSLTCTDSCAQGQTACISGLFATCTLGANGCRAYGAGTACGAHQSCTGSTGSAACTCNTDPVCTAVGDVCATNTTLATCAEDAQNCIYKSASQTCASGGCSAGTCCASGYQQACNSACGVTLCNGACSNTTADVGTACNHACGTIGCSGACSNTTAGVGTTCNSNCGTIGCSGACSNTTAGVGTTCNSNCGTIGCSGACSNTTAGVGSTCSACGGTTMCSGACSVPLIAHSNGVGGTYLDCNPLGTYSAQAAAEACASVTQDLATCQGCTDNCGMGGPGACLEITFNGMLYEWFYGSPSTPGVIFLFTTDGTNACFTNGTYGDMTSGSWN